MKPFIWDVKNQSRMGQYLTAVEMPFAEEGLRRHGAVRSVLDVGGASGRFAIPLARQGYRVTVLEIDPLPLSWLRARSPGFPAVLTSPRATRFPLRASSVDAVLAIEVPVLCQDWFWRECRRVLRRGGIVIGCTNNRRSYKGAVYRVPPLVQALDRGARYTDFYPVSAEECLTMAEANGFHAGRVLGFNWLPVRRSSDSRLIPWMARLERGLRLDRLWRVSPWFLIEARAA